MVDDVGEMFDEYQMCYEDDNGVASPPTDDGDVFKVHPIIA